ncbi:hypothetical protein, partial [Citrobacter braakii]|uniref:hypothetical protein n=1 Tax=Citrobacter braakii TaxID=57706 RepID=UPI001C3E2A57
RAADWKTGSFGPYGCPENLSVRFFPNSAGSPYRQIADTHDTMTSAMSLGSSLLLSSSTTLQSSFSEKTSYRSLPLSASSVRIYR